VFLPARAGHVLPILERMPVTLIIIVFVGMLLAFGNGANDNFKGVATIYGSGTASYRTSLIWATLTTALGSVAAVFLAGKLLAAFSGKDLVPVTVAGEPGFAAAVALGAAVTVLLATRLSFPVSTTHALIGALVGGGLVASSSGVDATVLTHSFMLPLLTSPFIAIFLTALLYTYGRRQREKLAINHETCICIGKRVVASVPGRLAPAEAFEFVESLSLDIDDAATCQVRYQGQVMGIRAGALLDAVHFFSAGLVSFARGLNDTPKIAALLLVGHFVAPANAMVMVGVAIALGGWLGARRIAETMAHRITEMSPGQGFAANIVTAGLVIGASNLGLPVSTTHVSCGSLFGIGTVTRQAHWRTIRDILLAWIITLPLAGLLGAFFVTIVPRLL
jgi:PiT family inorganic phosphate transporter